ncbi:response regulator [Paraburkholderia fungorum]|uniref:response regulator n=1 Tax=Paraburkholderia fungorum TaxID=134537 RepID=UPI0038BDAF69
MKTILVVDDDLSIVKSWARILRLGGYRVVTASDGSEGFAAARSERPAPIITDQSMPTMDGVKLCRLLKLESELAQALIILISADPPAADIGS